MAQASQSGGASAGGRADQPTSPADKEWDRLREEILQSQSTRSDLLKWKLGLVGVLGAAGLGLAGSRATRHADLVLCAVPFASLYVDLLAYHLTLRILVIGRYFWQAAVGYEALAEDARNAGAFRMEDAALGGATAVLSAAIVVYGVFLRAGSKHPPIGIWLPFLASGGLGLLGSIAAYVYYRVMAKRVKDLEPKTTRPATIEAAG